MVHKYNRKVVLVVFALDKLTASHFAGLVIFIAKHHKRSQTGNTNFNFYSEF